MDHFRSQEILPREKERGERIPREGTRLRLCQCILCPGRIQTVEPIGGESSQGACLSVVDPDREAISSYLHFVRSKSKELFNIIQCSWNNSVQVTAPFFLRKCTLRFPAMVFNDQSVAFLIRVSCGAVCVWEGGGTFPRLIKPSTFSFFLIFSFHFFGFYLPVCCFSYPCILWRCVCVWEGETFPRLIKSPTFSSSRALVSTTWSLHFLFNQCLKCRKRVGKSQMWVICGGYDFIFNNLHYSSKRIVFINQMISIYLSFWT